MIKWRAKQKGFTIVELLIVIVVIGILAAITIVAYNGIQQRARNQARIAAAVGIVKAIDSYTISTGTQVPGIAACLPTGTIDSTGDGLGDCGDVTDPLAPSRTEKVVMNNALSSAGIKNLSYPQTIVTGTNGAKYAGVQLTYNSGGYGINGVLQPHFVYFFLEGAAQDCGSSYSVRTINAGTYNELGYRPYYSTSNGITICAFTVQHPSNL